MKRMGMSWAAASLLSLGWAAVVPAVTEGQTTDNVPPAATKEKSSQSDEYSIPPVVPKNLKKADSHALANKAVKNLQGQELGQIQSVYIDGKTQQPMYAELVLKESQQIVAIPVSRFKQTQTGLTLDATQQQLERMGSNAAGEGRSADFEHKDGEPLKPNLRQGG